MISVSGSMSLQMFSEHAREIAGEDAVAGQDKKSYVVLVSTPAGRSIVGRGETPEECLSNTCTCGVGSDLTIDHHRYCSIYRHAVHPGGIIGSGVIS